MGESPVAGAGESGNGISGDIDMEKKGAGCDWKYGGLWALANIFGWGACASTAVILTGIFGTRNGELWMVLSAFLIGLAQWLVLAPRFSLTGWLIPAYGMGWYIGLWLGTNLGFLSPGLFMGAAGGALVGVMQWLSLRRRLGRSLIWMPAMSVSSLLGCWIGVLAGVSAGAAPAYAIGGAVAGAVIGVLSGSILVILIRREARRKTVITAGVST